MTALNRSITIVAACLLAAFGGGAASLAAESDDAKPAKPKPAAASLDDELFKDLSDGEPAPKPKSATAKSDAAKPAPTKEEPPSKQLAPKPTDPTIKPSRGVPAPKLTDPLDRELLHDLGGEPETKPGGKPRDGHSPSGAMPAGDGEESGSASDDPLVRLSRRVRDAERRLRSTDSGERTQELQRGIVDDLEKLIAQIEQEKSQRKNAQSKAPPSGSKPGQKKPGDKKPGNTPGNEPASNPTDSSEQLTAKKAEKPTTGKLKEMLEKVWGNLPERERQDVMQSSFEDFPAKYQFGIEQYFKTLLQRKD
jgi:hypothetical protein